MRRRALGLVAFVNFPVLYSVFANSPPGEAREYPATREGMVAFVADAHAQYAGNSVHAEVNYRVEADSPTALRIGEANLTSAVTEQSLRCTSRRIGNVAWCKLGSIGAGMDPGKLLWTAT